MDANKVISEAEVDEIVETVMNDLIEEHTLWQSELISFIPTWEYLFYEYDAPFSTLSDTVKNAFNAYGADGWRLVQEHILRTERWTTYHRAIFMREKREN